MTNTKTQRAMTVKGFLNKLSGARSAIAFIEAHRQYLTIGELAPITSPIVAKVDRREVMATPALNEIQQAVFAHMMAEDLSKAEASLLKSNEPTKEPKPYEARLCDENGNTMYRQDPKGEWVEITSSHDLGQRAEGWADRTLVEHGEPRSYVEIVWTKCPDKLPGLKVRRIERDGAMSRELAPKGGTTGGRTGGGDGAWRMKAVQTKAHFSKG